MLQDLQQFIQAKVQIISLYDANIIKFVLHQN